MANAKTASMGSDFITYTFSDGSTITLADIITTGNNAEGVAPISGNPGDITSGGTDDQTASGTTYEEYYVNQIGTYVSSPKYTFSIYDSRNDGITSLIQYLELNPYILSDWQLNNSVSIGYITSSIFDVSDEAYITSFGLAPTTPWTVAINSTQDMMEWAEAIMQGEGSNKEVSVRLDMPSGTEVTISPAYDVNFTSTLGGTEIDLDNDTASKIIDGSLWYTDNTSANTETFASNINGTYSAQNDIIQNQVKRWPGLFEHRFAFYKWKLCRVDG